MTTASVSDYVRAFIAIETDQDVKTKLVAMQAELRRLDIDVKWTAPEVMHLTLVFLGDIPPEKVTLISQAADCVTGSMAPFVYDITGLGYFGSPRSPRVIWADVRADPVLFELQGNLAQAIRKLDITLETRPFKPHLTLGRIKSARNGAMLSRKLSALDGFEFGQVRATSVLLIRSILKPHGPEYSVLHESKLSSPS